MKKRLKKVSAFLLVIMCGSLCFSFNFSVLANEIEESSVESEIIQDKNPVEAEIIPETKPEAATGETLEQELEETKEEAENTKIIRENDSETSEPPILKENAGDSEAELMQFYNDFEYIIVDGFTGAEVNIINYSGSSEHVIVPGVINGYPVTIIGMEAFYGNGNIKSVTLSENLLHIDIGAFADCTNLTSVQFPSSLSYIGQGAFMDCSSLDNLEFTKQKYYVTIDPYAFYGCSALKNLILPRYFDILEEGVFGECTSLENVIIPDGLSRINLGAFFECTGLKMITIPESVTYIHPGAFMSSSNFIIYGYPNSEAESFALANNFHFGSLETYDTKIRGFVSRMYTKLLNRKEDPEGIWFWTQGLQNESKSAAQIADFFVFSPEFVNQKNSNSIFLERMYATFFDRKSDVSGKRFWLNYLDKGATRKWVAANFINSNEFREVCEGYGISRGELALTDYADRNVDLTMYVYRCYKETLGRGADEAGLEFWCQAVLEGRATAKDVAESFVFSLEFTKKNLSDTEFLRVMYRTFMGREADSSGLHFWQDRLYSGTTRRDVFEAFADSTEFRGILKQYGLQ